MAKDTKSQKKKTSNSTKKTQVNKVKTNAHKKASTSATKKPVHKTVVEKVEEVETKPVEKVTSTYENKKSAKVKRGAEKKGIFAKISSNCKKNWEERRDFSIACIIIFILVITIILLAFVKRVPKLKNGESVLASVDGYKITSDDLYSDLKESYGSTQLINLIDEKIANKYVKKFTKADQKYVDQVVDYYKQYAEYYGSTFEDFLAQYVGLSGITNEEEFREYVKKDYRKTLAVQKYVGSKISDEELKKEYNNNYKEKLTVRHILIEVNDNMSDEDAKAKAADLIKQLDEVKDDSSKLESKFKDLAYDNSDDQGTYEDGGLFKNFSKNGVDENFYKASKKLKDGEYTNEPVKSAYGYHVILKVSSKTNKFKSVKNKIRTELAKSKLSSDSTLQVKSWDKLRKKFHLKINDSKLNKKYQQSLKDSLEAAKPKETKDNSSSESSDAESTEATEENTENSETSEENTEASTEETSEQ